MTDASNRSYLDRPQCRHFHEFGPQCELELGHDGWCSFMSPVEWESAPFGCYDCEEAAADQWEEIRKTGGFYPDIRHADLWCLADDRPICADHHIGHDCACEYVALSDWLKAEERRDAASGN